MSHEPHRYLLPPLDVDAIHRRANGAGKVLRYLAETPSTNRLFHQLAPAQWRHGMTFITDYQSAGRGRLGRAWLVPPRTCLLLSIALAYPAATPPSMAVMLAALAVSDAIEDETRLASAIKWPNDVLIGERKVSGILTELVRVGADHFAIVGVGINVNFDPSQQPEVGPDVTSLSLELGCQLNREALAIALFHRIDMWYRVLTETPETVFSAWSARLTMLGDPIVVTDGIRTCDGVAIGVKPDGGLLVRATDGTTRTVHAADVSVRRSTSGA